MPPELNPTVADLRRVPLDRLGFRAGDAVDVARLVDSVASDPVALGSVAALADVLRAGIDTFPAGCPEVAPAGGWDAGRLFLLAFLATVDDVRAAHRARGIDEETSWRSLADLGQQVWVHRQTFGTFGLHTQDWVAGSSWAANLFWLGRLQFNLMRAGDGTDGWWVSTHIPQSGPLTPAAVDAAFARARTFAARHFPDRPAKAFHCESWLLDPQLAEAVPGSNIAAFQARWERFGEPTVADAEVLFFVFRRRGQVDLAALRQDSRLERAVVGRLRDGGHWYGWSGTLPW